MAVTPDARDLELFVSCRSCGWPIASGIRMRAGELAKAELPPREHRCPRCGSAFAYAREDYAHLGQLRPREA